MQNHKRAMHNNCTEEGMSKAGATMEHDDDDNDEDVCHGSAEESMVISTLIHHRSKPNKLFSAFRAVFHMLPAPPIVCTQLAMLPGRTRSLTLSNRVTGTLFGYRKRYVHFCVQQDLQSDPLFLFELAIHTHSLVKEMASGLVRIALECERTQNRGALYSERMWAMYCNGKKRGNAIRKACSETDLHVLRLLQAISMGAGVLPMQDEGPDCELMYMRARFERIVGSKDSEAFYMMNPDGKGGPELSIFLLRI